MNTQMGFPQISSRFVDKEGRIDQAWLQLLIALWQRTGAATGADSGDIQYSEGEVLAGLEALRNDLLQIESARPPQVPLEVESPLQVPPTYPIGDLLEKIQSAETRAEAIVGLIGDLEQRIQGAALLGRPDDFPFLPASGAWTPVLTFATPGDLNVAYAANGQTGRWVSLGDVVILHGRIETSTFTHTTAAGNLNITGVPITALNVTAFDFMGKLSWEGITKANYTEIALVLAAGASILTAQASGSGQALSDIVAADMPTAGTVVLEFTLVYRAARP